MYEQGNAVKQGLVDEMDGTARELASIIVEDVQRMKQQISHPAMSRKLTSGERWELHGEEYMQTRESPEVWQMTIDQMGEAEAVRFSRSMELAMLEANYGATG